MPPSYILNHVHKIENIDYATKHEHESLPSCQKGAPLFARQDDSLVILPYYWVISRGEQLGWSPMDSNQRFNVLLWVWGETITIFIWVAKSFSQELNYRQIDFLLLSYIQLIKSSNQARLGECLIKWQNQPKVWKFLFWSPESRVQLENASNLLPADMSTMIIDSLENISREEWSFWTKIPSG